MGLSDREQLARAEARIGSRLRDKWRLDQVLGIGGMAAVFEATHRNGKQAAIKILHPEAALIADVKARFLREGYLANRVGHRGAVSILDDDVDEAGTVYLVMELLHGETVEQRWRARGKMDWKEVVQIGDQALDVLAAAHKKEIVHRDLKPGNLFIDSETGVKILDFGIARLTTPELGTSSTGHDTALGTPGFMPPEQARGRWNDVDPRSDLFALGATMFSILADRYVHEAETANEQFALAMTQPAVPIGEVLPELPAAIARVIDRALAFDKNDRWPDATSMREALRDAYADASGEELASLPKISVLVLGRSRSVRPDAPTVAADGGSASSPGRAMTPVGSLTSRPTSTSPTSSSGTPLAAAPPRSRLLPLALGAAVLVVGGVLLLREKPAARGAADTATARPPTAEPATKTSVEPAPLPAASTATAPEPSSSAAPPVETGAATVSPRATSGARTKSGAPQSSATPQRVDIFQSRK